MKSNVFEIGLLHRYYLFIPKEIVQPFVDAKQSRIKIKAFNSDKSIEFYAAIRPDKNAGNYKVMFGKRLQKELDVFQNDYFEMQLFEDTSKYGVDMPEELEAVLLSDYEAYKIY